MGSQRRRSGGGGGKRRGRSGGGGGGAGGDEGGGKPPVDAEAERIYEKASKKLDEALAKKDFAYVANIVTAVSISREPASDLTNLILAGAKAYRDAREREWKPELRAFADTGVRFAQEKTGHTLTFERQELYSSIITDNLKKTAERQGRKTP